MRIEFWHFELVEAATGTSVGHVVVSPVVRYIGLRARTTPACRLTLPDEDWSTLAGLLQAAEQRAVAAAIVVRLLPADLQARCTIEYLDRRGVDAGAGTGGDALDGYLNQTFAL